MADGVDLTALPLGDGHVSEAPERGSVWSCVSQFDGRGAFKVGEWIKQDGTFDALAKPTVDGEVFWPSELTISLNGDTRELSGNALPDQPTGLFPIQPTDDAYEYDRNPNSIGDLDIDFHLPAVPVMASQPSCLPLGPIGLMLTGNVFFNALDAVGRDAVAHEIQDACEGHPERSSLYHYHNLSICLEASEEGDGHSDLVGYAFDGFGIFGRRGEDGRFLTNAELDECHGHTHTVDWDGGAREIYHYHGTWEYAYTLGCFRGEPQIALRGPFEGSN